MEATKISFSRWMDISTNSGIAIQWDSILCFGFVFIIWQSFSWEIHRISSSSFYIFYKRMGRQLGGCMLSWLSVILWTVARQAPLSMGFPRQEYWSGLPFTFPGDLPDPGGEPVSPASPALTGGSLPWSHLGSPAWRLATSVISLQMWWSGPWRVRGCLLNRAASEPDLWVPETRILITTPSCVSLRVGVH